MRSVLFAEADKKRKERENFYITSAPVAMFAAQEPSLYQLGQDMEIEEGGGINCTTKFE